VGKSRGLHLRGIAHVVCVLSSEVYVIAAVAAAAVAAVALLTHRYVSTDYLS
jgi:hypothetical protein